jgi:(p)ppGpp synthase/HD superfamily hydrolase
MPAETTTPRLTATFDDALTYASELHRTQTRKGGEIPYVGHLLSVAGLVIEAGGSETQAVAALLHDAAEDQGGEKTLAEIRSRFGSEVAGTRGRMQRHVRGTEAPVAGAEGALYRASR